MTSRWLPLWTGILPIVAIHATYLVAASEGYVPWCIPYIDSCTSISATGRNGTAFFLFKGTMIPSAVLLYFFWRQASRLLAELGDTGRPAGAILWTGAVAAVFLVVYTVALGLAGDFFYLQRRIGIILYFSMTAFSELLLTWRLGKLDLKDVTRPYHLGICSAFLAIGIFTLILDSIIENYVDYEDAFEWILALLMHCYFLVMFFTFQNIVNKQEKKGPFRVP